MKIKLTLRKLLDISRGLEMSRGVESTFGFYFGISENERITEGSVMSTQDTMTKVWQKYANKDKDGKPMVVNGIWDCTPENKIKAIDEINEFLNSNEVEIDFHLINKADLPEKWTAEAFGLLKDLIKLK